MSTQEVTRLEEILRQKEAQRTEAKLLHDQLVMECNVLRSAIEISNTPVSEISKMG